MNFKIVILISVLLSCSVIKAHEATLPDSTCFDSIQLEAALIAFKTSRKSNLGEWYKETFNLKSVKEFKFPDGSAHGELMSNGEFVVEVFYRDDVSKESNVSAMNNPGFLKFDVYSNANLPKLKQCLVQAGVKAGRIFKDDNLKLDLLHVYDIEGNSIEIMSRH